MESIYLFRDPDTRLPIYIGKTNNLEKRKSQHFNRARRTDLSKETPFTQWLSAILKDGKIPVFEVLKENIPSDLILHVEQEYIRDYEQSGYSLMNVSKTNQPLEKTEYWQKLYWDRGEAYLSYSEIKKIKQKLGLMDKDEKKIIEEKENFLLPKSILE